MKPNINISRHAFFEMHNNDVSLCTSSCVSAYLSPPQIVIHRRHRTLKTHQYHFSTEFKSSVAASHTNIEMTSVNVKEKKTQNDYYKRIENSTPSNTVSAHPDPFMSIACLNCPATARRSGAAHPLDMFRTIWTTSTLIPLM